MQKQTGTKSFHSFFCCCFFLPDRPTHRDKRRGDGKRNILLAWPNDRQLVNEQSFFSQYQKTHPKLKPLLAMLYMS